MSPPEPAPQPAEVPSFDQPQPAPTAEPQAPEAPVAGEQQPIQWQAPEYMQLARSPLWFVGFWATVVVLMVVAIFVIKSWSFALLVPAMAAALVIYSHRPPRQIQYVASAKGLYINDKLHPISEFRSFGVLQEEAMPALTFIPTKRFRPGLTVYFPQEAGEAIVDLLGSHLPMKDVELDAFDKIVRKLHM